jgi:hypothetical protein
MAYDIDDPPDVRELHPDLILAEWSHFREVDWPDEGGLWCRRGGGIWGAGVLSGPERPEFHVRSAMGLTGKWETRAERPDLVGGWAKVKVMVPFKC